MRRPPSPGSGSASAAWGSWAPSAGGLPQQLGRRTPGRGTTGAQTPQAMLWKCRTYRWNPAHVVDAAVACTRRAIPSGDGAEGPHGPTRHRHFHSWRRSCQGLSGIPHGTVVYCGWSEGSRTGWGGGEFREWPCLGTAAPQGHCSQIQRRRTWRRVPGRARPSALDEPLQASVM